VLELLTSADAWLSLATLAALEIVLGVDNLIFIAVLAERLPESMRDRARKVGLAGAFVTRMILLSMISWIVHLTTPLFSVFDRGFTGKSLILLGGGLFLLFKATKEIHHTLEADSEDAQPKGKAATFGAVVAQIMLLDMVFSLDSVITAVGMTDFIEVMVAANVIALAMMLAVGGKLNAFVSKHPSVKVLALSFLMMIGLVLVAEGMGFHIPKGYVYVPMAFSVFVELINIRTNRKVKKVQLNEPRV
jgi:predicted tellurium resistance membrane protein TerC